MTASTNKPNVVMYAICVVAGAVIGAAATWALKDHSGGDPVVAQFGGYSIKSSEAFAPIKTRLYDLEDDVYRTKEQAINDLIEQRLLEVESKKQNMPLEQLLEKEAGGAPTEVSDKDINDFLASKGLSLTDPRIRKNDVRDYLKYRQRFEKRQAYVNKLKEAAHVKILLPEPTSPKMNVATEGYPTWGSPKAPVTIIEFSDFQCPFCSRAVPVVDQIKKTYGPDKVRLVYRDMPLPSHNRALPAAVAAHCANDQGKFWEIHDVLFGNQNKLEDGDLKEYAKKVGLDMQKFAECYDSKRPLPDIEKSKREADNLGIQATPSFIVNGSLLQGAQPFEKFKEKIDRALTGKG